jgi:hypothetical protein
VTPIPSHVIVLLDHALRALSVSLDAVRGLSASLDAVLDRPTREALERLVASVRAVLEAGRAVVASHRGET